MRLWVDDLRVAPEGWVWVKTIGAAIRILRTGKVIELALDHDLGGPREGRRVAQYIERKAFRGEIPSLAWRVLSDNGPGREEITAALKNADKYWERDQA
jgi:hypothetical protein